MLGVLVRLQVDTRYPSASNPSIMAAPSPRLPPVTITCLRVPDIPQPFLPEAATVMAEKRVRLLPVAEGEGLRGVVTRMDILTLHVLNPRR